MRTAHIIVISLCLLMLVLPCLAIPFSDPQDASQENRYLADYPTLVDEEEGLNPQFDSDFEDWIRDHFGFRTQAVRAYALADYRLLHTSANASVIAGKDGWLYFDETVPDYTGEGHLSPEAIGTIAGNLDRLAQSLKRRGARLYVAIVPNKSTIYPQYMPGRYAMRQDEGNIPLLREACEGLPLTWIDLVTPLREAARGDTPVYLRTDTHWNSLGVAICAGKVLSAMGREAGGYRVQGEEDFSNGDLARLLGAPHDLVERVPKIETDVPLPEADFSQISFTQPGAGEGRLVVYRDSFGTAIGPWLTRAYGESELLWEYPLDGTRPCDDALVLICERHLWEFLSEAPSLGTDCDSDAAEAPEDEGEFVPMDEDDDFFDDEDSSEEKGEFMPMDESDDFFDDEDSDEEEGEFVPMGEDDDFFDDEDSSEEEGDFVPMDEDDDFFDDDEDSGDEGADLSDDSGESFDDSDDLSKGGGR